MKKISVMDIVLIAAFAVFAAISHILAFAAGKEITHNFYSFFIEMMSFLPPMFILIGLFDVWFPKERVEKHIGRDAGIKGIVWIILLAMLQAGPLYGAFPVAYILWKKGAGIRNVFIYLGAFSSMKIPMFAFEIGFLGFKFSILRTIITIPVFILIAFAIEFYLKDKDYKINQPGE